MTGNEKYSRMLRFVPGFIRRDFIRKLMALILASIIYAAVLDRLSSIHVVSGVFVPPVEAPEKFVLMEREKGLPDVKVTVSGSQSLLKRLKPEDFTVVDLQIHPERYKEGRPYVLKISPENIQSPIGVKVISVSPESFQIDLDKLGKCELPVEAVFDSKMPIPPGYEVKKVTVFPSKVQLTGPSKILEGLKKDVKTMKTEPISLDRMTQSFDVNTYVALNIPDVKITPGMVLVQTVIEREISTKTFSRLPVRIMRGNDNVSSDVEFLTPALANVTVSAPSEILASLTAPEIKVYIDLSDLGTKGIHELKLNCWVSENNDNKVKVQSVSPQSVKVKIK